MKVVLDFHRPMLGTPKVAPNVFHQLRLVAGTLSPNGIGFDVLIKQFVRIEIGTVSRQEE